MDYILRPDEVLAKARRRPEWGDTDVQMKAARKHPAQASKRTGGQAVDDPFAQKGR